MPAILARPHPIERLPHVVGIDLTADEAVERQLLPCHRQRREAGHLVPPRDGIRGRPGPLGEPGAQGGLRVHRGGGEQDGAGVAVTGELGQLLDGPVVDHQSQLRRGDPEPGVRADDAEVTGEGDLAAGTHRRSVDGGDGADGQRAERVEHASDRGRCLGILDVGQVGPGAERRALTPHDHRPGVGGLVARGDEAGDVLRVDRVATVGPIERADQDVAVTFGSDHAGILARRACR